MSTIKKLFGSLALLSVTGFSVFADGIQEGVEYFKCGLYTPAKMVFLKTLGDSSIAQTEVCYYLGEVYYAEQKADSALYYYKKGEVIDATYLLNQVGQGKLLLKNNPVGAEAIFSGVLSGKNKKNPELVLAIARAYWENNSDKADEYLQKAKELDERNAHYYVLEGDMLVAQQKQGDGCSRYEQAIYFDKNCTEAYLKYARIYANVNVQNAIDMLHRLLIIQPGCIAAYQEIGEICYRNSRYKEAAEAFDKCVNSNCCSNKLLTRYATVLFYYGDFKRSLDLARQVVQKEPGDKVAKRVVMYDLFALKEYDKGLIEAEAFFKIATPEDIIGQDYLYHGRLLKAAKNYENAIPRLAKALQADSTHTEIYKELAEIYEKLNRFDTAAVYYSDFLKRGGKEVTPADYFQLGKCYYFAAADSTVTDTTIRKAHLIAADSMFGYVAEKKPDSYLGNFWRARVNSALDPETDKGLAQPYYEAAAGLLEKDGNGRARLIVECYSYLGYYYYLKDNTTVSKEYWNKILALDPTNEIAKKALEGIK